MADQPPEENQIDLDAFRRQWQAEVRAKRTGEDITRADATSSQGSALPESLRQLLKGHEPLSRREEEALTLYIQAVTFEQESQLGEALNHYQRAFKRYSHVDELYRRLVVPLPAQTKVTVPSSAPTTTANNLSPPTRPSPVPTKVQSATRPAALASAGATPDDQDLAALVAQVKKASEYETAADRDVDQLITQLRNARLDTVPAPTPASAHQPFYFASLPPELLLVILRHLLTLDVASVAHFSRVCQMFRCLARDASLWCWACEFVFSSPVFADVSDSPAATTIPALMMNVASAADLDILEPSINTAPSRQERSVFKGRPDTAKTTPTTPTVTPSGPFTATDSALSELEPVRACQVRRYLNDLATTRYAHDWRRFYMDRPRVRWDGMYTSTCCYIRQGRTEDVWHQPVHVVTYFRYLRFYRDGRCIKYLTTDEPRSVTRSLHWDIARPLKGIMRGRYVVHDGNRVVVILRDPAKPAKSFRIDLQVKSTSRGRHNRLSWQRYVSYDTARDNEESDYALDNFQPFYFSRVRSYSVI
ncbi:hypothetical protein IWQ60_000341 [Tieghemiomyces parasiticus]|uniref:F-box domain-containing protein n=1 Tax=Tieghemiomyces parasiticus TaxID=78921 RepID=A0A9W8AIQ4_9FUNG|nr:hypothetical protein IWQ60_000341 [Tieghemiomyces parasiticus]